MKIRVKEQIDIDYDSIDKVTEKVAAFAAQNGVPVKDVHFDVNSECEYGDYHARVYLVCDRKETRVEKDVRLKNEKLARDRQAAWDKRQIEELRKRNPELFK